MPNAACVYRNVEQPVPFSMVSIDNQNMLFINRSMVSFQMCLITFLKLPQQLIDQAMYVEILVFNVNVIDCAACMRKTDDAASLVKQCFMKLLILVRLVGMEYWKFFNVLVLHNVFFSLFFRKTEAVISHLQILQEFSSRVLVDLRNI